MEGSRSRRLHADSTRVAEVLMHVGFAAVFVGLFLRQAWDVLVIDETAFPSAAAGAAETGVPYFYNGETRPQDLGLWHPPLYVYTLAGWIKLFGDSIPVVRSFGMVLVLVAWLIGLAAITRILGRPCSWARIAFSAILLTNPLVINGALTPDIDGTWGIPVMALCIWLAMYIVTSDATMARLFVWTAAFAYLATWAKLTIVLMLLPVLMLAAILRPHRPIATAFRVLAGAAIGAVGAIASWWVIASLAGSPFDPPFTYFYETLVDTAESSSALDRLSDFFSADPAIFWLGPFLLVVSGAAAVFLLVVGSSIVRRLTLLLLGTTIFIVLGYAIITGSPFGHAKYWGIAVISAGTLIAVSMRTALDDRRWRLRGPMAFSVLLAAAALLAMAYAGKVLYPQIAATLADASRSEATLLKAGAVLFAVSTVALALGLRLPDANRLTAAAALLLTAGVIATTAQQTLLSVATARADFATRHYFGERGLAEVVAYLQENTDPDAVLLAAKDVGLQSGRRFYEDAVIFYGKSTAEFESFLADVAPEYVVTRNRGDYSQSIFPEQFALIDEFYNPIPTQPGRDFTIWERDVTAAP